MNKPMIELNREVNEVTTCYTGFFYQLSFFRNSGRYIKTESVEQTQLSYVRGIRCKILDMFRLKFER